MFIVLYCFAFLQYLFAEKSLLDYTDLFSPNENKKNKRMICKSFKKKICQVSNLDRKKLDQIRNYLLEETRHIACHCMSSIC